MKKVNLKKSGQGRWIATRLVVAKGWGRGEGLIKWGSMKELLGMMNYSGVLLSKYIHDIHDSMHFFKTNGIIAHREIFTIYFGKEKVLSI